MVTEFMVWRVPGALVPRPRSKNDLSRGRNSSRPPTPLKETPKKTQPRLQGIMVILTILESTLRIISVGWQTARAVIFRVFTKVPR